MSLKTTLRHEALKQRDAIPSVSRMEKDKKIRERLISNSWFPETQAVMLYASFRSEVDTFGLIQHCLGLDCLVVLPRVDRTQKILRLFHIKDISELSPGYLGIPEPPESAE